MDSVKSINALNVTFLVPFAGNRMVPSASKEPTIHILRMETVPGSLAQCGLLVQSERFAYNHRDRLKADEVKLVHDRCLEPVLKSRARDQERDFEAAHAEGLHADLPREFCPLCTR